MKNRDSGLKATVEEVSLDKDSKNNIVVGSGGRVKDLEMDNQITGLTWVTD